jgi:hypothetical protein
MDIFTEHIFSWIVVILLIGGGFYTMKIIGKEKSSFKDDSYQVTFGPLTLIIPNWWSITAQSDHEIRFERTDTRYDWYSVFRYFPDHDGKDLPELLKEKLDLEEMEFDEDVVFETDSRVLFRDSKVQEYFQEVIRVEGKGSQKIVERFYYDVYLMRAQNDPGYFIFESRSSVLNGLVEGPYFEESLSELELNS